MKTQIVKGPKSKSLNKIKLKTTELAWVAGLLEGEGCFTRKSKVNSKRGIVVCCTMTDCDVIRKLHKILGVGWVVGPYNNGPGNKQRYTWSVSGEPAYLLMKKLLPLMGKRRSSRIRDLVAEYDSVEDYIFRIQNLKTGKIIEITHLQHWLDKNNITHAGLYRTLTGARHQCKGWKRLT